MKRYHEMKDEELVVLTDEQIKTLIDYECALAGVPLLPPEPIKPENPGFKPDTIVYKVFGVSFLNAETAQKLVEFVKKHEPVKADYRGHSGEYQYVLQPLEDYDYRIDTNSIYSEDYYNRIKDQKQAYGKLKSKYDEDFSEWDRIDSLRKDTSNEVYEAIYNARIRLNKINEIRGAFDRYIELAEGDRKIAMNFLGKVYNLTEHTDLVQELCPGYNPIFE